MAASPTVRVPRPRIGHASHPDGRSTGGVRILELARVGVMLSGSAKCPEGSAERRHEASAGCRPSRSCRGPQPPGSPLWQCLLDEEAYELTSLSMRFERFSVFRDYR